MNTPYKRARRFLALASIVCLPTVAGAWSVDLEDGAPLEAPMTPANFMAAYEHISDQLQDADALFNQLTAPIPSDAPWDAAVARRVADTLAPAAQHDAASIHKLYAADPEAPCISVGAAHDGRLLNGVPLHTRPGVRTRKGRNWGTAESVAAIYRAVDRVRAQFPGTPDLAVGDLSRKHGGRLRPHKSHQSGRDADIGYYVTRRPHPKGLGHVSAKHLDVPRTFAFIEGLMEAGVEYMFVDYRLQKPLYIYARDKLGKSDEWLKRTFAWPRGRKARAAIRHLRGHDTHLHVRFHSPEAVAAGKSEAHKAYKRQALAKVRGVHAESIDGRHIKVSHKVRRGESLIRIAKRYRVDLDDLLRWNRIKRKKIIRPGDRLTVYKKRVSKRSKKCRRKKGKRKKGCPRS